jgi:hypothetical protein
MSGTPAITYRTDDFTRWGAGQGSNLSPAQVDLNFWNIVQAIADLQSNPGNTVVSVQQSGNTVTFMLANGQTFSISLPVPGFRWRGPWQPNTVYAANDFFSVDGVGPGTDGLYIVLENLTSAATFSASATDASGNAEYQQLWAFPAQPFAAVASIGGTLTQLAVDSWDGNFEIMNVTMPVQVTFPADLSTSPTPTCEVAPVGAVSLTLQQLSNGSATTLGTIDFAAGATTATFSFVAQVVIPAGESLRLYAPAGVDGTMSGFSATIVGTR